MQGHTQRSLRWNNCAACEGASLLTFVTVEASTPLKRAATVGFTWRTAIFLFFFVGPSSSSSRSAWAPVNFPLDFYNINHIQRDLPQDASCHVMLWTPWRGLMRVKYTQQKCVTRAAIPVFDLPIPPPSYTETTACHIWSSPLVETAEYTQFCTGHFQ